MLSLLTVGKKVSLSSLHKSDVAHVVGVRSARSELKEPPKLQVQVTRLTTNVVARLC